jgi:hypothetical protein
MALPWKSQVKEPRARFHRPQRSHHWVQEPHLLRQKPLLLTEPRKQQPPVPEA